MGNRYLNQFQYTLEKDTVTLFGSAVIGASGAVGTVKGGGIASVVKEATAGQYTITLEDSWSRFLGFTAGTTGAAISPVANIQVLMAPATLQATVQSTKAILIQCIDYAGAAVNPTSGHVLSFRITMRKSSVGPFDT
jgi:hypothetical protein